MSDEHTNSTPGISTIAWCVILLWPLTVAMGLLYVVRGEAARTLQGHAPVVVLDRHAFAMKSLDGKTADEPVQHGLEQAAQAAKRFSDAGYIVLDHSAVVAAPTDAIVAP